MKLRKHCGRLTEEGKSHIIESFKSGETVVAIAHRLNIGHQAVRHTLRLGGEVPPERIVISDETKRLITDSYMEGNSSIHISRQYGLSDSTVGKIIKQAGIGIRPQQTYNKKQWAEMVNAYENGLSIRKISQQFGPCEHAVYKRLKSLGVVFRSLKNSILERANEVIALYEQGKSAQEVAQILNTPKYLVWYYLKKQGLVRESEAAQKLAWSKTSSEARRTRLICSNQFRRGARASNWKGGITPLQKQIRSSKRYTDWRTDVFKRDSYTCQECGKASYELPRGFLQADHIYPFSALLHDHSIKSLERAFECVHLWNVENGRTLCKDCHIRTDTYLNGAKKYIGSSVRDSNSDR